jgi:hypothetical protein
MKERALLLFILFLLLRPNAGHGQDLPSAEILTADAAWITYSSGEQEEITGDVTFLH